MKIPAGIRDNLRFLITEVSGQVTHLRRFVKEGTPGLERQVLDRGGYAHNLKQRIHEGCVQHLGNCKEGSPEILSLRAVEHVATELERIAALSRDCVTHLLEVEQRQRVRPKVLGKMLKQVARGLKLVEPALRGRDTRTALRLGKIKRKLEKRYRRLHKRHTAGLKRGTHAKDRVAGLFLAHTLEQMGDALLGISESLISANLGQPINIERYHSLQASVAELEEVAANGELRIEHIADTRSGSGISGIVARDDKEEGYVAIYKDGEKRKLKEEREGVESWHEIYPGLAPRILSYRKQGQSASLLIEHLPGQTFEQILLNESPAMLEQALESLCKTLRSVWKETRRKKPAQARFMAQARKRMGSVYAVHREFTQGDGAICGCPVSGFEGLLKQAESYEQELAAPFSVYIHGDFNLDNIIYDPDEGRIHFIDLHRSCYMDYVQDISVFMVSNYRLQILDAPLRRRIMALVREFYACAARYARKSGDDTFELRLALGLARSFATSTRFILDRPLARGMFLRARYLIEQVLAMDPGQAARYRLPIQEIFVD